MVGTTLDLQPLNRSNMDSTKSYVFCMGVDFDMSPFPFLYFFFSLKFASTPCTFHIFEI